MPRLPESNDMFQLNMQTGRKQAQQAGMGSLG